MRRMLMPFLAVLGAVMAIPALAYDSGQLALARQKLKHVVVIFQENRSFDSYFGTFPGAEGFPPDTCVPLDPSTPAQGCVKPFHDRSLQNAGGPHGAADFTADVDGGRMDGFVYVQTIDRKHCTNPTIPRCVHITRDIKRHDIMGYHTADEIPNYWTYAQDFTLQDHFFTAVSSASDASHLYLVSEWSARCTDRHDPMSCFTHLKTPLPRPYPWTNLTYLLDRNGVSWKYYLSEGTEPDCEGGSMTCDPVVQRSTVQKTWNPLPAFTTFLANYARDPGYWTDHVVDVNRVLLDIEQQRLPTISWIVPSDDVSEHPPEGVRDGMNYVTTLVNAIMASSYWSNTVIFITWDDWGGLYDHVPPPIADREANGRVIGYGIRVPGLVISPFVRAGQIDHQTLSPDSYNRLIEDLFLGSQRLDPKTDGRPDSRPDVREALRTVTDRVTGKRIPVGDLLNDFDFRQTPLPPLELPLVR
jgi:phospholipase C